MRNSRVLKEINEKVLGTVDWNRFRLRLDNIRGGDVGKFSVFFSYMIAKNTDIFSEDVRDFLFNNLTYKEIAHKYEIKEGLLKNRIYRQVNNYFDFIGRDIYSELKENDIDEDELKLILVDIKEKYSNSKKLNKGIEDYFMMDIFNGRRIKGDFSEITSSEFREARDVISRLSIPANEFLVKNMDKKLVDYIVYLLTYDKQLFNDEELERRENLIKFMKLEEHFSK